MRRNLWIALVFLFPLAAHAEEKESLPSPEQEKLMQNCCIISEPKSEPTKIGELRPEPHWLRKLAKKKKLQVYAVDVNNIANGAVYTGRLQHGRAVGLTFEQTTGILE